MIHGYWDIRGLGQPIRLLLAYKDVDYQDKRYYTGPAPDYDKSEWFNGKFNHGFAFPNLPYLIDGDVKVTQTQAILRYLGRKYDLVGKTEEERTRVDMVEQQLVDLRNGFVTMCYRTYDPADNQYKASLPAQLKLFSDFLGDRKYFAGNTLTFVDFCIYEILFQLSIFHKESFAGLDNLTGFIKRIESLPTVDKYLKSDKYLKWPFNNNMARWGMRTMECPF
jgi:glutathione S-transferase